MDSAAAECGGDFIVGYAAYLRKGLTRADRALVNPIPAALAETERVCSSVSLARTRSGINMDAAARFAEVVRETALRAREAGAIGCGKLVCFAHVVEDNPFVAGAHVGVGEPETVLDVGVSGPGGRIPAPLQGFWN